jgi:beta-lactamase regulating signal transducer with metallopeptidase domain
MNLAFPTGPLAQAIGWALLHLLWQGALVAALLAVLLSFLSGRSASVRYAISCAALALIVALGVTTAVRSYPAATTATPVLETLLTQPVGHSTPLAAVDPARPDRVRTLVYAANEALPKIVTIWLAGVALFSVRLILEWLRARRLATRSASRAREHWQAAARRLSLALGVRHAVRVLESAAVEVPSVIGLVRPAILLPASALTGLTPAQLEMILAHELAHIRRHDLLVNLLQAVVETLLFYHPAVWWISRQVRIERENCCDDLAVAVCGNPLQYARALTRLEELRAPALPLAVSANGGSLFERIHRIAGRSTHATGPAVRGAAALAVLSCVLLAIAAPSFPAIGEWEPLMKHGRQKAWTRSTPGTVHDHSQHADENPNPDLDDLSIDEPEPPSPPPAPNDLAPDESSDITVTPPDDAPDADAEPQQDADRDRGHDRLTLDDVIALRTQNVSPEEVSQMRSMFPGVSMREIASMSAVGATPDFVREMRRAGLEVRTAQDAQGLAALGVTGASVRDLRASGLEIESASAAQGLAAVGVTPKFIRDMRSAGLEVESAQSAMGLAAVGVTAEFVRGLRAAGLDVKSASEAQGLAAVGVTPDYVREMRAAGVELDDVSDAQSLRALGVTPQFVKRLADAGYRHLTVDQLSRLGASGVTGDFIREMSRYRSH